MKVTLFIFGFLFALPLFAQEIGSGLEKPTVGPTFTNARKSNFSGFVGKSESTIFTVDYLAINRKKQEINLNRFHVGSLELIDSRDLYSVLYEDLYNEPNEIFYQNKLLFLFSDVTGLKDKYNLIYL